MAVELQKYEDELAQVRELVSIDDPEMANEARAEQGRLEQTIAKLEASLTPLLVPRDPPQRDDIAALAAGSQPSSAASRQRDGG